VPIVPVDLGPAIKECETTTRLRFDTDNCALRYENEDYPESGVADVIYVCDMLRCATLSCLGDVCDTPASSCDILVWNEAEHNWCPYTIPDDTIVTIVGVNAEGCLVKDDDLACVIGAQIPDGTIVKYVGLDSGNCLVGSPDAIFGTCDVAPQYGTFNFGISLGARINLAADTTNFYGVQATIPARTCPVNVFFSIAGAHDLNAHLNTGDPFHLIWEIALNVPGAIFSEVNGWHGVDAAGGSWSSGTIAGYSAVLSLPAGGPDNLLFNLRNDLNPAAAPTIFNYGGLIQGWFVMFAQ
jgi:hypothetical protein